MRDAAWTLSLFFLFAVGCAPAGRISHDEPLQVEHATPQTLPAAPILFPDPPELAKQTDAVAIRASLSHAAYTKLSPKRLQLKVDFTTTATARSIARPPLDIALVLDRSGSMEADKKLAYTIEAARWVISNLTRRDTLTIVAFNHEATVLAAAGRVVSKPFLFHRLEEVHPEGRTDISAALLEAIAQLGPSTAAGRRRHILLLTDGMANVGVTDPTALAAIAAKARAQGIGVSTLGTGTEFDERVLVQLARAGAGRYTYIKNPEQIPLAFKKELHGLLTVVAQNAVIRLSVRGGRIYSVSGQLLARPAGRYETRVGNLRTSERGTLMLEIRPDGFRPGDAVEFSADLTYDDPTSAQRVTRQQRGRANLVAAGEPLQPNHTVLAYAGILQALQRAEEAAEGRDTNRLLMAEALMRKWYQRAQAHAMKTRDQQLLNHAFMLKHFMSELLALRRGGAMHGHDAARDRLRKQSHYQRYLLFHHQQDKNRKSH